MSIREETIDRTIGPDWVKKQLAEAFALALEEREVVRVRFTGRSLRMEPRGALGNDAAEAVKGRFGGYTRDGRDFTVGGPAEVLAFTGQWAAAHGWRVDRLTATELVLSRPREPSRG